VRKALFYLVFLLTGCGERSTVDDDQVVLETPSQTTKEGLGIDVQSLIGTTKQKIDIQFGSPNCPPKNACVYDKNFEIFYVGGLAANLTLPPVEDLKSYGLVLGEPEFENQQGGIVRWQTSINGRQAEVSQFENYVYVKTAEPE
jgi:hypothetical protein